MAKLIPIITALLVFVMFVATVYLSVQNARRWEGVWRGAALLPMILLVVWTLSVVTSWPSEHNLWPLELILYCPGALLYMTILWGIRRAMEKHRSTSAP